MLPLQSLPYIAKSELLLKIKNKTNFGYTYACYFTKINKTLRSTNKFINYLLHPGQNIAGKLKNELFIFGGAGNKEQWKFQIKVVGPFCCGFENKSRRLSLI